MIKLLYGIERLGEEAQCKECDSIVHCEEEDWEEVSYWLRDKKRKINLQIVLSASAEFIDGKITIKIYVLRGVQYV